MLKQVFSLKIELRGREQFPQVWFVSNAPQLGRAGPDIRHFTVPAQMTYCMLMTPLQNSINTNRQWQ